MARRAVPDRRGPPDLVDGWSLRPRPGLLGRLERLLRLRASGRRHVEPQQLRRLRRPRGKRPRRHLDPGSAVRVENFEDFDTTTNGKVSARVGFFRVGVSTGSRAPDPRPAERLQHLDHLRPRPRRPRQQRHRRGGLRHRAVNFTADYFQANLDSATAALDRPRGSAVACPRSLVSGEPVTARLRVRRSVRRPPGSSPSR